MRILVNPSEVKNGAFPGFSETEEIKVTVYDTFFEKDTSVVEGASVSQASAVDGDRDGTDSHAACCNDLMRMLVCDRTTKMWSLAM